VVRADEHEITEGFLEREHIPTGEGCVHIILTSCFIISVVLVGILGSVLDDTFFPAWVPAQIGMRA
jgi:hypothetical protein